jgi:hypothetical protein
LRRCEGRDFSSFFWPAPSEPRWRASTTSLWRFALSRAARLRQPGRRGQPQRRAHGALLLAGLPDACPARPSTGCAARASTRSASRRARSAPAKPTHHRRRRREHVARALRHGQGDGSGLLARAEIYDTTIGWRFVNPLMKAQYGIDSMPETAENVAEEFQISRADQDAFAVRSQAKAWRAQPVRPLLAREIVAGRDQGPQGQG